MERDGDERELQIGGTVRKRERKKEIQRRKRVRESVTE